METLTVPQSHCFLSPSQVKARRRGSLLLEEETAQQHAGPNGSPAVGMEQNVSVSVSEVWIWLGYYFLSRLV